MPGALHAQDAGFASRSTRPLVGFAPGGATDGAARAIAPCLSDVPSIAETGVPGYEVFSSYGPLAPRGTPPAVIARIAAAVRVALETPEVITALARQGPEALPGTPEEDGAFLRADAEKWAPLIRANNLRAE